MQVPESRAYYRIPSIKENAGSVTTPHHTHPPVSRLSRSDVATSCAADTINEELKAYCEATPAATWIDVRSAVHYTDDSELFSLDGLHFSPKGSAALGVFLAGKLREVAVPVIADGSSTVRSVATFMRTRVACCCSYVGHCDLLTVCTGCCTGSWHWRHVHNIVAFAHELLG